MSDTGGLPRLFPFCSFGTQCSSASLSSGLELSASYELSLLEPLSNCNGLFTLPNSDSKPYGYIVLCRNFSHWFRSRLGSLSHSICIVQESASESESESESGNVNKPKNNHCARLATCSSVHLRENDKIFSTFLILSKRRYM